MAGQPRPEGLPVEGRVIEIEAPERQGGQADPGPVGPTEMREADQAGGEVKRRPQTVAAQATDQGGTARPGPRPDEGHVEAVLKRDVVLRADPAQEGLVLGAAPQEHVLTVVEGAAVVAEGAGEAAEGPAAFEQGHLHPGVDQVQGRAQSSQASSDDHHVGRHTVPRARARAATAAFSQPGRDNRPRSTTRGSR